MERSAVWADRFRQHLPNHAGDALELLEPDPVQRARAGRRRAHVADAQKPVHALRRPGLSRGVSRRWGHRPVHQRHRGLPASQLHRLRLLHYRLPIRHSEDEPGDASRLQVHALRRPRQRRPRAGVYDPPGVGGTGVIYVLHDASNPEIYGGLPKNPHVPWSVKLWKGPLKWLGNVAMIGGLIGLFVHYLRYGPKAREEEDLASRPEGGRT